MDDYDFWFILLEISNKLKINLIKRFKNAKEIWYYTLNEKTANFFVNKKNLKLTWDNKKIDILKKNVEECNIKIATINDDTYPKMLKQYEDVPFALFYKGNINKLNTNTNVSIVGSRDCSVYGINVTKLIVDELCNYDINIISGMAKGIDFYAHSNCIRNMGFTCAILGSGVDVIYPKENAKLYNNIIERGCVISEFPPGTKPFAYNFPIRNKIIGGLGKLTVVIEAGMKSGSLITANSAIEQGNEVVAVPGSVFSKNSVGTNNLIKDGAFPFTCIEDIFDLLSINYNKNNNNNIRKMSLVEKQIYTVLSDNPMHIDDLIKITNIDIGRIYGVLFEMQLKDEILCLSGNFYARVNKPI